MLKENSYKSYFSEYLYCLLKLKTSLNNYLYKYDLYKFYIHLLKNYLYFEILFNLKENNDKNYHELFIIYNYKINIKFIISN